MEINEVYFDLKVLSKPHRIEKDNHFNYVDCECLRCGTIKPIRADRIGIQKSCGCRQHPFRDLTGQRFGKLVAKKNLGRIDPSQTCYYWECVCDCGSTIITRGTSLTSGHALSCGECGKSSKGEAMIAILLKENNIPFVREKTFDGLVAPDGGRKLRFDFYIPSMNACIEFDGLQHVIDTPYFGGLDYIKQRDKLKNDFCLENGISLYRIPYSEVKNLSFSLLFDEKFLIRK